MKQNQEDQNYVIESNMDLIFLKQEITVLFILFLNNLILQIQKFSKISIKKTAFYKLLQIKYGTEIKVACISDIIIQYHMKLLQKIICVLFAFALIDLASGTTPPYIHKLPLQFTENYVYYADLYLGPNGQNVTTLVDTGSRTLAVFCSLCKQGCVVEQEFIVEVSPTFENVTCGDIDLFLNLPLQSPALKVCKSQCRLAGYTKDSQCKGELNYGSSSLASFLDYLLIRDQISVRQGDIKVNTSFGCIYNERNFDTGIWGLALSPDNQFLDEIYQTDQANGYTSAQKLFTICTAGGSAVMNIGGVDTSNHIGNPFTINVDTNFRLWWKLVSVGDISYSGTQLFGSGQSFGTYGIILDSGTDFIIFPASLVNMITNIAENICNSIDGCKRSEQQEIFNFVYQLDDASAFFNGQFITFTINGQQLQTPLSNYFWSLPHGRWALAVVSAERFNFQMAILGSIWMNNFDIEFDRENKRVQIHDITGCETSQRRLQTEDGDNDYDLPKMREDKIDGADVINRLKVKHQRGIAKMLNEDIEG